MRRKTDVEPRSKKQLGSKAESVRKAPKIKTRIKASDDGVTVPISRPTN
jgi:hypothetical protein